MSRRHLNYTAIALSISAMLLSSGAHGRATVGSSAQMFVSHDEDLNAVDMSALVKDKPLVLIVGSAS